MANVSESRDAKRGKPRDGRDNRKGGSGKVEAVPAGRTENRSVQVFRREGVEVRKVSVVNVTALHEVSKSYEVTFTGHPVIPFDRLADAVERAKGEPPAASDTSPGLAAAAA